MAESKKNIETNIIKARQGNKDNLRETKKKR